MSKQSTAKINQNYQPSCVTMCMHCASFTSDKKPIRPGSIYFDERNLRCAIGGFKVKKMGTCKLWYPKTPA